MSRRLGWLDRGIGETRGVVTLDGRPERLLIHRDGDVECQRLGARSIARVRRIERGLATAFLEMPDGPDAAAPAGGLVEGAGVEIEITAEARAAKGPVARVLGAGEGEPRVTCSAPDMSETLAGWAQGAPSTGHEARAIVDEAEAAALARSHDLPGGGRLTIEPTQALIAIDVDSAGRSGGDARRLARQLNLTAIAESARLLRLKGLGGLVVIDLVGKGHDGAAMAEAAKTAFAPDGAGVSIGPISRFGLFELSIPHARRPVTDILCDDKAGLTSKTLALRLTRAIEREGRAHPGAHLVARCAPGVAEAAGPYIAALAERLGARFGLVGDPALAFERFEISAR